MKKKTIILAVSTCVGLYLQAQIPNASFEDWENGVPTGWSANNVAPLSFFPIQQSSSAHTGSAAVRGEVVMNPIFNSPAVPAFQNLSDIPVSGNVPMVGGMYVYQPSSATTYMTIGCTALDAYGLMCGYAVQTIYDAQSEYTAFELTIDYSIGSANPASKLVISFGMGDDTGEFGLGSYFLLDDLAIGMPSSLLETEELSVDDITFYPNPITDYVTLKIKLKKQIDIQIDLLDMRGRVAQVLLNQKLNQGIFEKQFYLDNEGNSTLYFLRILTEYGSLVRPLQIER